MDRQCTELYTQTEREDVLIKYKYLYFKRLDVVCYCDIVFIVG